MLPKICFQKVEILDFIEINVYHRSDSAGSYARFILVKNGRNLLKLLIGEGFHLLPNRSSPSGHFDGLEERAFKCAN